MKPIRISHPQIYPFQDFSGPGAGEIEDGRVKSWVSESSEVPGLVACLGSFSEEVFFNQNTLLSNKSSLIFNLLFTLYD